MGTYDRQIATAQRLIARYGGKAVLRQTASGGGDPWAPGASNTDTDIIAVRTEEDVRTSDGTLTQQVREDYLVSTAAGVVPTDADKVAFGFSKADNPSDDDFIAVDYVKRLSLDGTDILYTLRVLR